MALGSAGPPRILLMTVLPRLTFSKWARSCRTERGPVTHLCHSWRVVRPPGPSGESQARLFQEKPQEPPRCEPLPLVSLICVVCVVLNSVAKPQWMASGWGWGGSLRVRALRSEGVCPGEVARASVRVRPGTLTYAPCFPLFPVWAGGFRISGCPLGTVGSPGGKTKS